jgi:hypothetical protein
MGKGVRMKNKEEVKDGRIEVGGRRKRESRRMVKQGIGKAREEEKEKKRAREGRRRK